MMDRELQLHRLRVALTGAEDLLYEELSRPAFDKDGKRICGLLSEKADLLFLLVQLAAETVRGLAEASSEALRAESAE